MIVINTILGLANVGLAIKNKNYHSMMGWTLALAMYLKISLWL